LDEFFGHGSNEPFFVKNLETIQGDERDVILVSVGYGRDENGRLNRTFGPVNLDGGERRLNVLFTRARSRCEIFSNFTADDLVAEPTSSRGIHVLKMFLEYADTGILPEDRTMRADSESPFEDSVADVLRSNGYEVVHQVGCAGFRIDLGVRDPAARGRFVIGIECDGRKYHSSPVARDRDRLRQQVLESRGWRIYRVWSTDWYRSREDATDRLLRAMANARSSPVIASPATEVREERNVSSPEVARQRAEATAIPIYERASLQQVPRGELHLQSVATLKPLIENVVQVESPVHFDEVVRRIREHWGVGRAGSRIRKAIELAVRGASRDKRVVQRGDFLWSQGAPVKLRRRVQDPPPDIRLICDEEIAEGIHQVLREQFATPREELISATARLFGIQRAKRNVSSRIGEVIDSLVAQGGLTARGGRLEAGRQ
jgi:very-short-patch-repair endonuclease